MKRWVVAAVAVAFALAPALAPAAALGSPAHAPIFHGNGDAPDRPKDDGIPKPKEIKGNADILPIDPTVVVFTPVTNPNPVVYGQDIPVTPQFALGGAGPEGLSTQPECAVAPDISGNNYPAGIYSQGLVCQNAVAAPGYTIGVTQPVTATLTITAAPLMVTASSADAAYGTVPTISATFDGFQRGDTPDKLTTQPTCTTTATTTSSPGAFTSSCTGAQSGNYTFTYTGGVVNIVPAALTITPSNGTAVYGKVPAITPTFTGLVNGPGSLTTQPTCVTTVTATTGAGTFTDTTSCSGAVSPNYTISYGPAGTTTITPANLTVTALGQSRLVGQPNGAFSVTYAGFVNGQTQSVLGGALAFTTEATAASGPGSYPLLPSGLSSPNYAISFLPGTIRVTAVPPPTPTPTPTPTVTPTKSPTPTPSPTRTNTVTPTPPPTPSGGGWPLWLTFVLIGAGVLVIALLVVGGIQLARRGRGEHTASE